MTLAFTKQQKVYEYNMYDTMAFFGAFGLLLFLSFHCCDIGNEAKNDKHPCSTLYGN